jgi:hypothetical protein
LVSVFIRQTLPLFGAHIKAIGGSLWPKIAVAPNFLYRRLGLFAIIYMQGSGAKMRRPLLAWIAQLVLARLQAARSP